MMALDSDLLIAILKKDTSAGQTIQQLISQEEPVVTTVVNAQEVLTGAFASPNPERFRSAKKLLESLTVLDYSLDSAFRVVEIDHLLARKGRPIGVMDTIIAGICLENDATIITRNLEHFKRVPGLDVQGW